jgi:hypothetical protein
MKCARAILSAGFVLAVASPALAQGVDEFGPYGGLENERTQESPQNAAFEVRFGPYHPNVDNEFNGPTPFGDTFGDGNRYLFGFELDWQALRIPGLGTFGPGFGLGYTKFTADALLADGSGNRSAQSTTFTLLPLYAVGVLRVDVLAREAHVPLVPYAKAGFGNAFWWAGGPDGVDRAGGTVGRGLSYGPQFALGGMFLLDILDPGAAQDMDNATGVNNSYFFVEWYMSRLGLGNQMRVGTNTWMLGLAFEI